MKQRVALDPEWVAAALNKSVELFAEEMEREPTRDEVQIILAAVIRYGLAPDAPSTRLQ